MFFFFPLTNSHSHNLLLVNIWMHNCQELPVVCNHMQVSIEPIQGKRVEHNGVKVELLGQIGALYLVSLQLDCQICGDYCM